MCFFISQSKSIARIAGIYGRKTDVIEKARRILAGRERDFIKENESLPPEKRERPNFYKYHIAEKTYNIPAYNEPQCIVVGASRQLQVMQWGIYPRTAKPEDLERYAKQNWFKNAHGERIYSEKTWPYYQLTGSQRCLIPVTGFMEYHWFSDRDKQPYFVHLPYRETFMIAGLYEVTPVPGKKGTPGGGLDLDNPDFENYYYTYTQITTDGNEFMNKIHNGGNNPHRMPMILAKEDEYRWLDPSLTKNEIQSLIRPYTAEPMAAYPISKSFRNMNPLAKDILDEVPR